jgi:hypothetical protein
VQKSETQGNQSVSVDEKDLSGIRGFFRKHGSTIGLVVLVGYVILLGIGVIAEVFKIQWILDWWIWSPPGKFK